MKKLNHPHIINMWEVIDDPNQEKIYMILDYAEGGVVGRWANDKFILSTKLVLIHIICTYIYYYIINTKINILYIII